MSRLPFLADPRSVADRLVDSLEARVPRPPPPAMLRALARFRALPEAERLRDLPRLYMMVERARVEVSLDRVRARDQLRTWLRCDFPDIACTLPFAVLFASEKQQRALLARFLLERAMKQARIGAAREDRELGAALAWLDGVPDSARMPAPFGVAAARRAGDTEWPAVLARVSDALFAHLERSIGREEASRVFDEAYRDTARVYERLPGFTAAIEMLPAHLLDEGKIGLLTSTQVRGVLREKIGRLKRLNDVLAERNRELSEARQESLNAAARVTSVFETLGEAIVTANQDGRIVLANVAAERMWGLTREALVGSPLERLAPPRYRRILKAALRRVAETGRSRVFGRLLEVEALRTNGSVFPIELSVGPTPLGGVLHFTAVIRDLTARRRAEAERHALERQLLEAQKLESLGILAGGVAHDFNNLLQVILGNASLVIHDLPEGTPARQHLDQIQLASRHAADLARQMLAYAGRAPLASKPLDLNDVADEMLRLLAGSLPPRVTIRRAFAASLPPLEADRSQIGQVVMNLVMNAAEAVGDRIDGTVTVTTGTLHADRSMLSHIHLGTELPEGTYVFLEVRDDGNGMDDEKLARMFDPFFSTKFTGRGLGLAAVLGIVHRHRGAIAAESTPGAGTSFRVLLPTTALAGHGTVNGGP